MKSTSWSPMTRASRPSTRPAGILISPRMCSVSPCSTSPPVRLPRTGRSTSTPARGCAPWGICASLWSVPPRRPRSLATPSSGRWATSPSTRCCTFWGMTTWTKGSRSARCAAGRRPSPPESPECKETAMPNNDAETLTNIGSDN